MTQPDYGAWNSSTGGTRKELEKAAEELRQKVEREAPVWERKPISSRKEEAIEVLISHGYEEEAEVLRQQTQNDKLRKAAEELIVYLDMSRVAVYWPTLDNLHENLRKALEEK